MLKTIFSGLKGTKDVDFFKKITETKLIAIWCKCKPPSGGATWMIAAVVVIDCRDFHDHDHSDFNHE